MIRSYEVYQNIEARGLEMRHRGNNEGGAVAKAGVKRKAWMRIGARPEIRVEMMTRVKQVLSNYLAERNKYLCEQKRKENTTSGGQVILYIHCLFMSWWSGLRYDTENLMALDQSSRLMGNGMLSRKTST